MFNSSSNSILCCEFSLASVPCGPKLETTTHSKRQETHLLRSYLSVSNQLSALFVTSVVACLQRWRVENVAHKVPRFQFSAKRKSARRGGSSFQPSALFESFSFPISPPDQAPPPRGSSPGLRSNGREALQGRRPVTQSFSLIKISTAADCSPTMNGFRSISAIVGRSRLSSPNRYRVSARMPISTAG